MRIERGATIALFGGTGFIGRVVARQLTESGYAVRVITRRELTAGPLSVLPSVEIQRLQGHGSQAMASLIKGVDGVVNLVGILHESSRKTFQSVHVDWVAELIEACQMAGVSRLIHVSAVGAHRDAPSRYLRSKAAAEDLVRASPLKFTILSPSVVFGPGDQFLNLFAGLMALLPILPLACPQALFQPVYVEDVARSVVASFENAETLGETLRLGGPDIVSMQALIQKVGQWTGQARLVVPLPLPLSYLQAALMECMPVPLMTRDNVRSMQVPNVAGPFPKVLGFGPQSMDLVVPHLLGRSSDAYRPYRRAAAR